MKKGFFGLLIVGRVKTCSESQMKLTTPVLVGMIIVALSACAKTTRLNGITTEDISGSSVVKEQGGTTEGLFYFFTTPITGSKNSAMVISIDGKKVSRWAGGREWRLVPGKHTLEINCTLHYGSVLAGGVGNIEVDLISGHTYQIESKVSLKDKTCDTALKDVTNSDTVVTNPN